MERYHHGNLRAALLRAAFHLVGKKGLEAFTLREVARRAGVSHNAPYRHFSSREDLLAALATEGLTQLHEALETSIRGVTGATERLRAASRAYLRFALDNRARFEVMFHSAFDRETYPEYVAAYNRPLALLAGLMQEQEGLTTDVEKAGDLIWASVHGITVLGLSGRLLFGRPELLQTAVDDAVETLRRGLTAQSSA